MGVSLLVYANDEFQNQQFEKSNNSMFHLLCLSPLAHQLHHKYEMQYVLPHELR